MFEGVYILQGSFSRAVYRGVFLVYVLVYLSSLSALCLNCKAYGVAKQISFFYNSFPNFVASQFDGNTDSNDDGDADDSESDSHSGCENDSADEGMDDGDA